MNLKFTSNQCAATPGALAKLDALNYPPRLLLSRHFSGDWSEMDMHDQQANHYALSEGTRIFSAYNVEQVRFWVITEADRSVTTILLPSEY